MLSVLILRRADSRCYPLLMEVFEVLDADSVAAHESVAFDANDGNKAGVDARVVLSWQGFLSLAGKGDLAGSSLSGPDGHKKSGGPCSIVLKTTPTKASASRSAYLSGVNMMLFEN
jgi:hypothetical protein